MKNIHFWFEVLVGVCVYFMPSAVYLLVDGERKHDFVFANLAFAFTFIGWLICWTIVWSELKYKGKL